MKFNLAGEGNGSPLPDPEMTLEDPEAIRCFRARRGRRTG